MWGLCALTRELGCGTRELFFQFSIHSGSSTALLTLFSPGWGQRRAVGGWDSSVSLQREVVLGCPSSMLPARSMEGKVLWMSLFWQGQDVLTICKNQMHLSATCLLFTIYHTPLPPLLMQFPQIVFPSQVTTYSFCFGKKGEMTPCSFLAHHLLSKSPPKKMAVTVPNTKPIKTS